MSNSLSTLSSETEAGIGSTKAAAFAAVPDVIARGRIIDRQTNRKGRGYDTIVVAAPVSIAGKEHVAAVVVERRSDNKFYLHEAYLKENLQKGLSFKTGASQPSGAPAGDIDTILRNILAVNPESVSKVIDANGEPLVVWHYTQRDFTAFHPEQHFGTPESAEALAAEKKAARARVFKGKPVPDEPGYHEFGNFDKTDSYFLNLRNPVAVEDMGSWWGWHGEMTRQRGKNPEADGFRYENREEGGGVSWMAFDGGSRIKSATDNSGEFSPENDSFLYSSPAPFYSRLERVVAERIPVRATPAQIMATIEPSRGSGVKAEEIRWSGIVPALRRLAAENNGKVPRDRLLEYLRDEGAVRFEEVERKSEPLYYDSTHGGYDGYATTGSREDALEKLEQEAEKLRDALRDEVSDEPVPVDEDGDETSEDSEEYPPVKWRANLSGDRVEYFDTREEAQEEIDYDMEWISGEAARIDEDGLVLYDYEGNIAMEWSESGEDLAGDTKYSKYTLPGGNNYREMVLAMPDTSGGSYASGHFSDVPNYVAHMRTNERTDADGKPGLFVEEIQSDRHQAGREKGYRGDPANPTDEEIRQYYGLGQDSNPADYREEMIQSLSEKDDRIPDAPFRKDWPLAMFKRALRDAVEDGKQWIGWTTGETQNDRFDLSKQVEELRLFNHGNGYWDISAKEKGGGLVDLASRIPGSKLVDHIGKDMAARAVETQPERGWHAYSGVDLQVGGSGMKGFYDNILPKEVAKYVRQWGGKVEKGTLPGSANPNGNAPLPFWKVDVTKPMRDGVEAGQTLYSSPAPPPEDLFSARVEEKQDIRKAEQTSPPPDLFAAATAPDAAQKLGDVRVGRMHALSAYRTLTARREKGIKLTAREEQQLLDAEQALGQKLAFDMEAVKGTPTDKDSLTAQPAPARTPAKQPRAVQQSMSLGPETSKDGQMTLFSSPSPQRDARYLELAKDPEGNKEELQKMADAAAKMRGMKKKTISDAVRSGDYFRGKILGELVSSTAHIDFGNPYNPSPVIKLTLGGKMIETEDKKSQVFSFGNPNAKTYENIKESRLNAILEATEYARSQGYDFNEEPVTRAGRVMRYSGFHKHTAQLQKAIELAQESFGMSAEDSFVRFGNLPEGGRSKDHSTGNSENGVSVFRARVKDGKALIQFGSAQQAASKLAIDSRPLFEVGGQVVGTGADGELVLAEAFLKGKAVEFSTGEQPVYVFPSGQIKSADPVTYDAEGKPIPLSQRFNPEKDSILYSSPSPAPQGSPRYDKKAVADAVGAAKRESAATAPETLRQIGKTWLGIARRPDALQLGKALTGKTVRELAAQIPPTLPPLSVREMGHVPHPSSMGSVDSWEISSDKGRSFILKKSNMVWVDTSATGGTGTYEDPAKRAKAGAGASVYQIAQAFARNNGWTFIPDPQGVSEIAAPRRWAHMLSSIARFGDAKHLDPYDKNLNPELPGWEDNASAEEKAGRLAMAEYSYVKQWFPEIDSLQIDPDFKTIRDADGNSLGTTSRTAFEDLLQGRRHPALTGIGETTLLRALVTHLSATGNAPAADSVDPGLLDDDRQTLPGGNSRGNANSGVLRTGGSGGPEGGNLRTGILYSSPAPEAGDSAPARAAVEMALAKMPPLYADVFRAVEAGAAPEQVMERFPAVRSTRGVTNILNQVRARIVIATRAAAGTLEPETGGEGRFTGGRPDLAESGNPDFAATDQILVESGIPDRVPMEENHKEQNPATRQGPALVLSEKSLCGRRGGSLKLVPCSLAIHPRTSDQFVGG